MKRILIVSPHFPPINAPDMQRVRMALPHYRESSWEPTVLTVDPCDVDGVTEPELLQTVPEDVRVVRVRAASRKWSRRFGIGSLGHRAFRSLDRAAVEMMRRGEVDLTFFSNTQFITFPLGRRWWRRFGVPYVLDFQDPWRTDYYQRPGSRRPPGGWKYQVARLQARLFEGWTVRGAAGLMSVSESYLDDLRRRYGALPAATDVIPFGASRRDVAAALRGASSLHQIVHRPGEVHFLYTGASGPVMPHAITVLFDALRQFAERMPDRANRLRFHFYGTSYVAPGEGSCSVLPLAAELGVAKLVDEIPHRLGHLESMRLQSQADVLLLPGSSDLAYSPSKIYPYFLARKPTLGIVFRDSVMERLLDELGFVSVVRIREHESKTDAHAAIQRFFDFALDGFPMGSMPKPNDKVFDAQYGAEVLARRQCALFDRVLAAGCSRPR